MAGKVFSTIASNLVESVERIAEDFDVQMQRASASKAAGGQESSANKTTRINHADMKKSFLERASNVQTSADFSKACQDYKDNLEKEFWRLDPQKSIVYDDCMKKIKTKMSEATQPERLNRLLGQEKSEKHHQEAREDNEEALNKKARWGHYAKWMGDRLELSDPAGNLLKKGDRDEFDLTDSGTYTFYGLSGGDKRSMKITDTGVEFNNSITSHNNHISGLPFQTSEADNSFVLIGAIMTLWSHYKVPNQFSDFGALLSLHAMAGNINNLVVSLNGVKPRENQMFFARLVVDFGATIHDDSLAKLTDGQRKELQAIRDLRTSETQLAEEIQAMRDRLTQKDTADVAITATNSGLLPNDVARYKELCAEITKLHKEHYNSVNMHPGHTDCFGGYGRYKEMADQLATISKALPPENQKNVESLLSPIKSRLKEMNAQLEHLTPNRKAKKAMGKDIERDVDSPLLPKDQENIPLKDQANIPLKDQTSIPLKDQTNIPLKPGGR